MLLCDLTAQVGTPLSHLAYESPVAVTAAFLVTLPLKQVSGGTLL